MDKIVYIYGSGRSASTREARRVARSRSLRIYLGPWTIRPARRTPVPFAELAKYEREVLHKVQEGSIQIENSEQIAYSMEELQAAFSGLSASGGIDYSSMPYATLMDLMRGTPAQGAWDAFVERSLDEVVAKEHNLPDLDSRINSLVQYAAQHEKGGLDFRPALARLGAARERLQAAARDEVVEELVAPETPAPVELEPAVTAPPPAEPVVAEPSDEQMDFSEPAAPVAEEPPVTAPEEPVAAAEPAARTLPEGWQQYTNAKLQELFAVHSIPLPERVNKASLVAALEAWAAGGS